MKLAPLLLTALLLTGCTSGGSETSAATAGSAGDTATSSSEAAGAEQAGAESGPADVLARVGPASSVVRTGEMEVVVEDVRRAAEEAARLVQGAGGFVEADERARDGGPDRAVLRLRIPPADFDATVGQLGGLGRERSRRLGSEDVSEQVVDLDSRLATQRASVARVRALLADADDLGEVVQVEGELTRRTADLESLEARLRALTGRADLGTLSLRLTAEDDARPVGAGPLGFSDGLSGGWDALRTAGRAVGVAVGALLPWSPVLLAAVGLVWWARRRTA